MSKAFDPSRFNAAPINPVRTDDKVAFDPAKTLQRIKTAKEEKVSEEVALLDRPIGQIKAWSFSSLMKFEDCPYSIFLKQVEKCPDPSGPAAERGSRIHTSIEDYIQGLSAELDPEIKHFHKLIDQLRDLYAEGSVEIEQDWAFNRTWEITGWRDKDCWERTKLDAFIHESETSAWIIDWKTGRKYGNEMKHGQQLQLYAIAAFLRYPDLEFIKAEMRYLDKNEELSATYTKDQAMRFLKRWTIRGNTMTTATTFPAKPSRHNCRWCPHKTTQEGFDKPACDFFEE
ncbi:PD-(D/E)XK nuclease family protein [Motiliproteus coralliicola]|uniref:PD-(D/E)XK nuclease family protein n=1 Tax=Motiliproteus coralliicola TaxID=2283196 RepID=A0A369WVM9_9GAMM|nr:PD-(D/E)XK nuclease family protein [Motiliproteus coralliicola]RDE25173.1 PD-(D/E)XK nuclease family protein [Motiliproteus coralliicola]